ncbi:MAG: NTE family protein [Saprospiraceae bacterium]
MTEKRHKLRLLFSIEELTILIRVLSLSKIQMKHNPRIALVFSGGGARGAFQIGAWEALQELGLSEYITGVYGTSVGAINGAAFVQQDLDLAKEVWSKLSYNNIFAGISEEDLSLRARKRYYKWVKDAIKDRGMDVSPLKEILRSSLKEDVLRENPVDFGLVTYNLTNRSAQYLTKQDIPQGDLVEYVIASATFPTFQPHRIEGSLYLDGGIVDNRPVGFLTDDSTLDCIICVDVTMARHFWTSKRKVGNNKVYFIRPSRLLGSPLAFKTDKIDRNMLLGYQDGLKQLQDLMRKI